MSEDRGAKLRERAHQLLNRGYTPDGLSAKDVFAALRQTEEEAREEGKLACEGNAYPHWCRDGHDRIGFSGDNEMCPACLARAEGERAGREAEREAWLSNVREFKACGEDEHGDAVMVAWRGQRWGKGPILWAVTRRGFCLNHDGQWEYEPSPSNREDDFIERCRWHSFDEACAAAIRARGSE